jgi:hypothetical protein
MCFHRSAISLFSALLFTAAQMWAASFPRSIVPVAGTMDAQRIGKEKTYGCIVRTALTPAEMAAQTDFDITLPLRNRDELQKRINRGEVLSRAALEAYLPTVADYARALDWMKFDYGSQSQAAWETTGSTYACQA